MCDQLVRVKFIDELNKFIKYCINELKSIKLILQPVILQPVMAEINSLVIRDFYLKIYRVLPHRPLQSRIKMLYVLDIC